MMFRKLILILALPLVFSSAVMAESGEHYLKEGVVAFKEGRYQDAVAYFKRARDNGIATSNVSYNLGSSYYKMNEYRQARTAFIEAAKNTKFQKFSWYNLGLIERKLGNNDEAVKWFRKALTAKGNPKIDALANQMIQVLSPSEATTNSSPRDSKDSREITTPANKPSSSLKTSGDKFAALNTSLGYEEYVADLALDRTHIKRPKRKKSRKIRGGVQVALGNDDNVIDANNNTGSGLSSTYLESFGYVDIPLGENFTLSGDIYNQRFPDVSSQDFRLFKLGIHYTHKVGSLRIAPAIIYGQSQFGSLDFQDIMDYRVTVTKRLGKGKKFLFRFRYSDIEDAQGSFTQYEGDRQQYRFEYKTRIALGKLRFRYQIETNDRANTVNRDYSPTRNDFRIRLKQKIFAGLTLSTEVQYRISSYDPISNTAAILAERGRERDDDRIRLKLDLSKKVAKDWRLGLRWIYTDNESTGVSTASDSSDSYNKSDIQIYAAWSF